MVLRRVGFMLLVFVQSLVVPVAYAQGPPSPAVEAVQRPVQEETQEREQEKDHLGQQQFWSSRQVPGVNAYALRKQALEQIEVMRAAVVAAHPEVATSTPAWTLLGPVVDNFYGIPSSGATSQLAVNPTTPTTVYSGFQGGGVWKSNDSGATWTPLTDFQPFDDALSFTMDPNNPETLYVGSAGGWGGGLLKSTDGGQTWTDISGPFVGPFGPNTFFGGSARINQIAVQPGNSNTLLAGAFFGNSADAGVYRSADGGNTWTRVLAGQNANSVMFNSLTPNIAYSALCSGYGPQGGLYKSTDAGVTWTLLTGGLPTPTTIGGNGCFLAISPSNPLSLAVAFNFSSGPTVFTSSDGGATWVKATNPPDYPHAGGVFFSALNPSVMFIGSADLFRTSDGGKTWVSEGSYAHGIHPDIDGYSFVGNSNAMYLGTDGGVYYTADVTAPSITWKNLNGNTPTLRVYPGMSLHPTNANVAIAGTQDEGTMVYSGITTWTTPACGDGGSTAISQTNPSIVYLDCYTSTVQVSTNGGQSFTNAATGINPSDPMQFFPPLSADPSNGNTVYFGTNRVYQSTDAAQSWTAISPAFNNLASISVSPKNSNTVYAAEATAVWVSNNASSGTGATWSKQTSGLPPRQITQVVADPYAATTAYTTVSGFTGFGDSLGHVFKTTDGGTSWSDISGNLPNIPADDLAVDPDILNTLYLATDGGAFESSDGGVTWAPYGTGLPNVIETGIQLFRPGRLVRVSTFGRGVWSIAAEPTSLTASPGSLAFGNVAVNSSSSPLVVTLTNSLSSASIAITGITASGNFSETNTCGVSLPAASSCTISVTFLPLSVASLTGLLTVDSSYGSSVISLSGSGIGTPLAALSVSSLTFANQPVGIASSGQTVTLSNMGSASLRNLSIALTGSGGFGQTSTCASSLAINSSCSVTVSYIPSATGSSVATLSLSDNAANSPQTIALSGAGIPPFTLSSTAPSATISAGALASYALTFASAAGYSTASSVQFTCTGAPSLTTCTVTPSSLPSGTGTQTVAVAIQTTAAVAYSRPPASHPWGVTHSVIALCGMILLGSFFKRRGISSYLMIFLISCWIVSISACGGSSGSSTGTSGSPGTAVGSYTISIIGQSTSYQTSQNLTLAVQ